MRVGRLASAGRGFRAHGYGGLGVDGIAKAAGVTSGAFYAHFPSKAAAFRSAVAAGHGRPARGRRPPAGDGRRQVARRLRRLLPRRAAHLRRGRELRLQALSREVARGDADTRDDYEAELRRIVDLVAEGLKNGGPAARRAEAIALLALLAGSVSIARAVNDPAFSEEIAEATRQAAGRLATAPEVA